MASDTGVDMFRSVSSGIVRVVVKCMTTMEELTDVTTNVVVD